MAIKLIFKVEHNGYTEEAIEFTYVKGMAFSQKQKCVDSLHESIKKKYPALSVLEVSSKSRLPFSQKLSAFNLLLFNPSENKSFPVETIFQSSKVFEGNVQYKELLYLDSRSAKTDPRLRESGRIIKFSYQGVDYKTIPLTLFYDWIYLHALKENELIAKELLNYDIFTDIEFNEKRSINCQARSCAIYVYLCKNGLLDEYLSDINKFERIYQKQLDTQMTLF